MHYYRKNGVQNEKSKQYATIASNQICFQNKKSTNQRQKKRKSKTSEVQQESQTAPIVDRVTNSTNQQSSVGLTTIHHVTTCDLSQNSPTNKPVSIESRDTSLPLLRVFQNSISQFIHRMRPFYYKSNNEFCVLGSLDSGSSTCPNARQAYGGPNKPNTFQTAGF